MLTYDALFIGWGKGGKTLAKQLAAQGKKVAMVEKQKAMAGGACINVACIPTKVLAVDAKRGMSFDEAMSRRDDVVSRLNETNYKNLAQEDQIDIYFATASFTDIRRSK